jgi:hypothetical protein
MAICKDLGIHHKQSSWYGRSKKASAKASAQESKKVRIFEAKRKRAGKSKGMYFEAKRHALFQSKKARISKQKGKRAGK